MTVIISVKINDGIVMASDSASTFGNGQNYLHADKVVNLVKGKPIGAMVTGSGSIGSESISTLLKDLRRRLDGSLNHEWTLREDYTMQLVSERVREFLYEEKARGQADDFFMLLKVCGYSAHSSLPEIWEVRIEPDCGPPTLVQSEEQNGIRWDGEYEPLNRLILGRPDGLLPYFRQMGLTEQQIAESALEVQRANSGLLYLPAMPIQDAIDLAEWLARITVGYQKFNVFQQPKTVGGSIELAVITKHEGFKWVRRRHFYSEEFN